MNGDYNPRKQTSQARPSEFLPPTPPPPIAWTFHRPANSPPASQTGLPDTQDGRWGGVLILSCLVIGVLAGMLELERSRVKLESDHAMRMMTAPELSEARGEALGSKLADPRTHLIHLSSQSSKGIGNARLAYNDALHWGALICDNLPMLSTGKQYEIWAIAGEEASRLAAIDLHPGVSIYPFHFDTANVNYNHFEITDGPRSADKPPLLDGEIQ